MSCCRWKRSSRKHHFFHCWRLKLPPVQIFIDSKQVSPDLYPTPFLIRRALQVWREKCLVFWKRFFFYSATGGQYYKKNLLHVNGHDISRMWFQILVACYLFFLLLCSGLEGANLGFDALQVPKSLSYQFSFIVFRESSSLDHLAAAPLIVFFVLLPDHFCLIFKIV